MITCQVVESHALYHRLQRATGAERGENVGTAQRAGDGGRTYPANQHRVCIHTLSCVRRLTMLVPIGTAFGCSARAWWACSGAPPSWGLGVVSSVPLGSTRCCGCRGPPACLGGSPECVGRLRRVPGGLEGENRILEAATEPPATGFGVGGK